MDPSGGDSIDVLWTSSHRPADIRSPPPVGLPSAARNCTYTPGHNRHTNNTHNRHTIHPLTSIHPFAADNYRLTPGQNSHNCSTHQAHNWYTQHTWTTSESPYVHVTVRTLLWSRGQEEVATAAQEVQMSRTSSFCTTSQDAECWRGWVKRFTDTKALMKHHSLNIKRTGCDPSGNDICFWNVKDVAAYFESES